MPVKDYVQAVRLLNAQGHGTVETTAGVIVSGLVFDIQSPVNDPDGIGYVTIKTAEGRVVDIYQDEFSELLETW